MSPKIGEPPHQQGPGTPPSVLRKDCDRKHSSHSGKVAEGQSCRAHTGPHAGLPVRQRVALAASGTGTAEELPQSPMQSEAPGQTQGPAGVPLPLSCDEDDESMDFSNSRKRLREESGDKDDHAPRKQMAITPSESSEEESHTSQGSEEMSGSECRTTVDSKVASTTADMTSSATTGGTDPASWDGAGTCQLPTTASPNDLPPQRRPSPHTEGLPLPAASPQGVESTLPAPEAEGTTDSPDNPPPAASAAMEVVEEVLTSTATGGNTRKEAPYTAKDSLLTPSAGPTPTNRRKKGKKSRPISNPRGHHKEAQQCSGESPRHRGLPGITTRSARRRARGLAAAALPVNPATVGTVPFRSSAPGDTFSGSPCLILAQALSARPGVAAIPVNQKRNIVAPDATTRECLEQLLTIKEVKGIPVTAKEPADHRTSTGFLHGVDREPAANSLLPGIQSAVPVISAAMEGANRDAPLRRPCAAGARVTLLGTLPSAANQTPPPAVPAMRSVRSCQGELQLARQLHQMRPDPTGRELQTDPAPV
ncbi:hypothetical protein HPB51_020862 [Rhipicephalus microplus]|uniref:Uncharacterized protein n=1 Tax=Rhipicephalus microplus TaxID=6941 RepID=A0A9J6EBV6_RHIMP|nr:hypothetical protein HPB51_020862 [Rhipicephalus microplus]